MPENKLVYSNNIESMIRKAKEEKGLSNYQIIVNIIRGCTYDQTKSIAKKWHKYLGISYGDFMKMARNRYW